MGLMRLVDRSRISMNKPTNKSKRSRRQKSPKLSKELAFFRGPEKKETLTYYSQTNLSTSFEQLLSGIAQGTDYNQRIGNVIRLSELEISLYALSHASATVPTMIRWAIVADRQCNGAALTYSQVYDTLGGSVDPTLAFRNTQDWEDRFMILHEERGFLPLNSGGLPVPVTSFHRKINLASAMGSLAGIKFSSTGGTVVSIATNSLYFICAPSSQAAFADGTNLAKLTFNCKLRFTDA